jgi:hypothetical protein
VFSFNSERGIGRREAKKIYNRLMATLPAGKGAVLSPPVEFRQDADIVRQYDNRNVLYGTYAFGDYELIALFEQFGEARGYRNLLDAAKLLRDNGLGHRVNSLTDAHAASFASFEDTVTTTLYSSHEDSSDFPLYRLKLSQLRLETKNASLHALMTPEDGLILESIVRQGIFDEEKIRIMLDEIKDGTLASVISDGFL